MRKKDYPGSEITIPAQYSTTSRYTSYTDVFAGNGYVVVKPDYRGRGNSEGDPDKNPQFWQSISPIFFVKDISGPLQLHYGTADFHCYLRIT